LERMVSPSEVHVKDFIRLLFVGFLIGVVVCICIYLLLLFIPYVELP
jgi:hypothetical protein